MTGKAHKYALRPLNLATAILIAALSLFFVSPFISSAFADVTYKVKKGDTLSKIARKHSVKVNKIKELNGIAKANRLKPGQTLVLKKTGPRTYTVKKGDNIYKISKKFGVKKEDLIALNSLGSDKIKPGMKLTLDRPAKQDVKKVEEAKARAEEVSLSLSAIKNAPDMDLKERLLLAAGMMMDIPYKFGGNTLRGLDCSAFVQKAFGLSGIFLPRAAREQFNFGVPVEKDSLDVGDLVFFRTYARFPSHVGIYLGDNLFIHASSRFKKVTINSLESSYYLKRFIGARRMLFKEGGIED